MDAKAHKLESVLGERNQWVVPVYQRHYSWKSEEDGQIPTLWDDWRNQTSTLLENRTLLPHYFGAIIYSEPKNQRFGTVPQRYLVDGQQRITTFQLSLAALREASKDLGYEGLGTIIDSYLFNAVSASMSDRDRERYKLWSSNYDRDLYRLVLEKSPSELRQIEPTNIHFYNNGKIYKGSAPGLLRAYILLYEKIVEFVESREKDEGDSRVTILDTLLEGFLSGFQIVVIQLDDNDDAQEIFSSLNGKAQPLAPFDLIRNDVFHRARKKGEDDESLFDNKWKPFEDVFWNKMVKQGRLQKARADHFVGHVLIAETAKEINLGKIATEYQNHAREQNFDTIADEIDILLGYASTYRALEEIKEGVATSQIAQMFRTWDLSTFHPLVLWIDSHVMDEASKIQLFLLIESYAIRREICGLTAKGYNKVAAGIIREVREKKNPFEAADLYLGSLSGDASKMPTDLDVFAACLQFEAYKRISSQKLQYIFKKIEENMKTKFDESAILTSVFSIEHIMPTKWAENWPLKNGVRAPDESIYSQTNNGLDEETRNLIQERGRVINTLGNLTLVTDVLNPSIGNSAWKKKKESFQKSLLVLNRDIAGFEKWDEEAIKQRAGLLAGHINAIWPASLIRA